MQKLNYEADGEGKEPAIVAHYTTIKSYEKSIGIDIFIANLNLLFLLTSII